MNWRHFAITGLVAGMVAITGCASNMPESNQGNRNGQRVADAVNRREDTYRTTGHRLGYTENSGYNRVTRGIRRGVNNVTRPTRNVVNNPLNIGRPQGRIGNTFRYGHNRADVRALDNYNEENYIDGYDNGVTTSQQALVSNSASRTTAPTRPTRSTTRRVNTTREATPTTTTTDNRTTNNARPTDRQIILNSHPTANNGTTVARTHRNAARNTARNGRYGMKYNYTGAIGMANTNDQTVPVMNNDDMAFFRKKTDDQVNPQQPTVPPVVQPTVSQVNDESYYDNYDNSYDNSYDDTYDNDNEDNADNNYNTPDTSTPTSPNNLPVRSTAQRAMK